MARRQLQIAGTERTDIPPEVDAAGEKWLELRKEARRGRERATEAKAQVIALMGAFKVPVFKHRDPDTGEVITLGVEMKPHLTAKKSGEVESEVGDEVRPSSGGDSTPGPHEGLIKQAMDAQNETNVTETEEGDVGVPDKAAPKAKAKKKRKAK